MLGLQFDNEIAAIDVLLVFLQKKPIKQEIVRGSFVRKLCSDAPPSFAPRTHGEVEALGLLLIGSSLSDVRLAHVGVRGSRLDRLRGLAVLEGLRNIEVFHGQHVL